MFFNNIGSLLLKPFLIMKFIRFLFLALLFQACSEQATLEHSNLSFINDSNGKSATSKALSKQTASFPDSLYVKYFHNVGDDLLFSSGDGSKLIHVLDQRTLSYKSSFMTKGRANNEGFLPSNMGLIQSSLLYVFDMVTQKIVFFEGSNDGYKPHDRNDFIPDIKGIFTNGWIFDDAVFFNGADSEFLIRAVNFSNGMEIVEKHIPLPFSFLRNNDRINLSYSKLFGNKLILAPLSLDWVYVVNLETNTLEQIVAFRDYTLPIFDRESKVENKTTFLGMLALKSEALNAILVPYVGTTENTDRFRTLVAVYPDKKAEMVHLDRYFIYLFNTKWGIVGVDPEYDLYEITF